jgi:hypothetical protein
MTSTEQHHDEHDGQLCATAATEMRAVTRAYRLSREIAREMNDALNAIGITRDEVFVIPAVSGDGRPRFIVTTDTDHPTHQTIPAAAKETRQRGRLADHPTPAKTPAGRHKMCRRCERPPEAAKGPSRHPIGANREAPRATSDGDGQRSAKGFHAEKCGVLRFSHRLGFWRWSSTSAVAVMAPILEGSRVTRRSAGQVFLSRELAGSAGARSALMVVLGARFVRCEGVPLTGTQMPIPAPA